jgi:hypothetical protein
MSEFSQNMNFGAGMKSQKPIFSKTGLNFKTKRLNPSMVENLAYQPSYASERVPQPTGL